MESTASAALSSWNLSWLASFTLVAALYLYVKGWLRGRRLLHDRRDAGQLASYVAGIVLLFLAIESPLDTFDSIYLSAHMAQHLLLMMIVPPLLLIGRPFVPLLRGLPTTFVKEALGPFLNWAALRCVGTWLVAPATAWALFAVSSIVWHLPKFYELALSSANWHAAQHAFFFWTGIVFWWPVVEPLPRKSAWPQWAAIPYLLLADLVNTGLSATFVFSDRILYPSYKSLNDQVLAGLIMWVPGSLVYLVPAFLRAMSLLQNEQWRQEIKPRRIPRRVVKSRATWKWRRAAQAGLLAVAVAVMWDGFSGRQVAPMNLAGTLPWIYWRGLSMLALLVVGNLFCMACPFMLVRDVGRRFFFSRLRWTARPRWPKALRNKWLVSILFLVYLWAYEALGLWNSPWLTAWIIAGYFLSALLIDGFFKGASFCKYVCPIGQFHFVTSLVSPREIGVKSQAVCQDCKTFDCIRGNARVRGCELDLFQPKKVGNLDCTFCLDCVKACPHDNVGLISVIPGKTLLSNGYRSSIGRLSKRKDWVGLVLVIVFGAFVNAGGMTDTVMMWGYPSVMIPAVTVAAAVLSVAVCGVISKRFAPGLPFMQTVSRFALVLAPLGIGMWAAHVAYHLLAAYLANVAPLEILLLDAGLLLALYLIWRVADELVSGTGRVLQLAAPWAALAVSLYCAGLWILFQPMLMRGMM